MELGMIMIGVLRQLLPEVDLETRFEFKWFIWEVLPGSTIMGGEVGSVYTVHYLVSFHCGHLGFRQYSRRGDHGSCAEHASELKKLEHVFINSCLLSASSQTEQVPAAPEEAPGRQTLQVIAVESCPCV